MSDIKLFGKTIPFPDTPPPDIDDQKDKPVSSSMSSHITNNNHVCFAPQEIHISIKGDQDSNSCHMNESRAPPEGADESPCLDPSLKPADIPESVSSANEKAAVEPSKSEDEKADKSISNEKTLKKPDKILPCPRCNSMDTKFCYYNNYNVNQPRHFCRKCQRYWTAGGNMRNVPVGAGRRKNKSSTSHSRQVTVPEALQNTTHPGSPTNSKVLSFGSDSPLCESMTSILNIAEKTMPNYPSSNGFQKPELKIPIPIVDGSRLNGSNLEDTAKSSPKEQPPQICLPYSNQIPFYPVAPWAYHWNSSPPFSPNGIALPYYPAPAFLGCTVPGTWTIPWITQPSSAAQLGTSSSPNSATLGKHSRDGNVLTPSTEEKGELNSGSERSLWVPKTLRIDDPREAAKSSIWTTLGIKHSEKPGSIGRGSGLFKAFQSKCDERTPNLETSTALEANPAALSRSQNFQENT